MSCSRCQDLCVTYRIRTPGELTKALSIVTENLADNTLEEIKSRDSSFERYVPFDSVATGSAGIDLLAYRFRCTSCGQVFTLLAEAYHGSGGAWEPEPITVAKSDH